MLHLFPMVGHFHILSDLQLTSTYPLQIEQQLASLDDFLREPVNSLKEQSLKFGSGLQSTARQLFDATQSGLNQVGCSADTNGSLSPSVKGLDTQVTDLPI